MSFTPRPVGIRRSTRYVPEVESLRGLAVLLVYAFHLDMSVMQRFFTPEGTTTPLTLSYVRAGYTGVSLFFVLSGFLLSLPYLTGTGARGSPSHVDYLARRALRILPLYYTVVLVAAIHNAVHWSDLWRAVPYLLFLNAFELWTVPLAPYSGVWWSLATEVQFYLALPLIAELLRRRQWWGAGLLLVYATALGAFLTGLVHTGSLHRQGLLARSVFGQGPLFLCGVVAARVATRAGSRLSAALAAHGWICNGGADGALLAALGALALVLQWTLHVGPIRDAPPFLVWHLPEGVLWTAILLLLLLAPLRLKPLLANAWLRRLGVISYSVYLVHVPVLAFSFAFLRAAFLGPVAGWSLATAAAVVPTTILCLLIATLTYHFIERPFLVRKERLDR